MEQLSLEEAQLLKRLCHRRCIDLSELRNDREIVACQISGIEALVTELSRFRETKGPIVIVGDYDVDGAVSTALLCRGLRALGFYDVTYIAPKRMGEGYGLSPELLERVPKSPPGILITVDNGIRAFEGTDAAKKAGWAVFITDHHLPSEERLPAADLIVNPKLDMQKESFRYALALNLAGVGVVFYCLKALYDHFLSKEGLSAEQKVSANPEQWLDLVALGTIADVVPLDSTNRALVMRGLRLMRRGKSTQGIQALLAHIGYHKGRIAPHWITTRALSCQIAPLINAAGRMDDITLAIDLLIGDDAVQIAKTLERLNRLNIERRAVQEKMLEKALQKISTHLKELPAALTLADPTWHLGIVGILASQIKSLYHRPVAVFGKICENLWRGSIRSTPEKSLSGFLKKMTTEYKNEILQAGGHACAAGITLTEVGLEIFTKEFARHIQDSYTPGGLDLKTDGPLRANLLSLRTVQLLNYWIPWGAACEEPCFEGNFFVLECKKIGKEGQKFLLRPTDSPHCVCAITFAPLPEKFFPMAPELYSRPIRLCYRMGMNFFAGISRLQLYVESIKWSEEVIE